ncbi:MAG TPA: hypothetical protein VFR35_12365, partial [Actinoplanes sp.]|nr:hypothetical protein [Actinoplanes sp.]
MPIPLPNLDDRDFAQLTAQARALIPTVGPEWTNHNAADPGITLVELLAWLTEMLLFQVNEVTPQHTEKFLGLLNEPGWAGTGTAGLTEATRATILALRERYRAVTAEDYEDLTRAWSGTEPAAALGGIQRVHCIPRRDLTAADPLVRGAPAPGHVSVVIVPVPVPGADDPQPRPTPELCAALWEFLDGRRTLTTHHHVIAPNYVPVEFGADLAPSEGV